MFSKEAVKLLNQHINKQANTKSIVFKLLTTQEPENIQLSNKEFQTANLYGLKLTKGMLGWSPEEEEIGDILEFDEIEEEGTVLSFTTEWGAQSLAFTMGCGAVPDYDTQIHYKKTMKEVYGFEPKEPASTTSPTPLGTASIDIWSLGC